MEVNLCKYTLILLEINKEINKNNEKKPSVLSAVLHS